MRSAAASLRLLALVAGGCGQESDDLPDLGPRPDRAAAAAARDARAVAMNPRLSRRFEALQAPAEGMDEALVELGRRGRHQIGTPLAPAEIASIVAWLGSLTGELPARYARPPELPPDGPRTAQLISH